MVTDNRRIMIIIIIIAKTIITLMIKKQMHLQFEKSLMSFARMKQNVSQIISHKWCYVFVIALWQSFYSIS